VFGLMREQIGGLRRHPLSSSFLTREYDRRRCVYPTGATPVPESLPLHFKRCRGQRAVCRHEDCSGRAQGCLGELLLLLRSSLWCRACDNAEDVVVAQLRVNNRRLEDIRARTSTGSRRRKSSTLRRLWGAVLGGGLWESSATQVYKTHNMEPRSTLLSLLQTWAASASKYCGNSYTALFLYGCTFVSPCRTCMHATSPLSGPLCHTRSKVRSNDSSISGCDRAKEDARTGIEQKQAPVGRRGEGGRLRRKASQLPRTCTLRRKAYAAVAAGHR
jgi:hypothetical protein